MIAILSDQPGLLGPKVNERYLTLHRNLGAIFSGPKESVLKSIPFTLSVFFTYHVEITLKGISVITLTWFPHGNKKDCQQKWNTP